MSRPVGFKHTEETKQKIREHHMGHSVSEESRRKIREAATGRVVSEETKKKISLKMKGKPKPQSMRDKISGENHPCWKGDDVGMIALHLWVNKKYKKENQECEFCGSHKNIQAACIGEYKRPRENWKFLCAKCHTHHDGIIDNLLKVGMNTRFKKGWNLATS